MEDSIYYLALNKIFGYKPRMAHALIEALGSPRKAFEMTEDEKHEILGPFSAYSLQMNDTVLEECRTESTIMEETGTRFITFYDKDYPPLLKECPDSPIGLYLKGSPPSPKAPMIAVVGTRDISPYGSEWCTRIINALSACREKPVIVSGLALGTDITAHQAAIDNGLATIGVMATGPDRIYPQRHRSIADKMCRTSGCGLVTDYPFGTAPLAINFIRRNRIIAGMSHATILIESKIKGGGMMTARLAFDYNRDVYALPGRIDDPKSQGCNHLIRNEIANPITSLEELVSSLSLSSPKHLQRGVPDPKDLYRDKFPAGDILLMSSILSAVKENRGISIEEIAILAKTDYRTAARLTSTLESDGLLKSDILNRFMINAKKM